MGQYFLYPLLTCSGFAGLGYQITWTRSLSVSLGHEYVAVLAVLAAFFVGLALGGFALNQRLRSTNVPARWYCALEILIGFWALLFIWLLPSINPLFARWMGTDPGSLRHWGVAFGASLFVLLPATAAMGATLPALERLSLRLAPDSRLLPGLYAANTLGAMLGVVTSTFVLLPALGLSRTVIVLAVVNFLIAALLWKIVAYPEPGHTVLEPRREAPGTSVYGPLGTLLFMTGLLGIGYEVLVVRVLSQVLEGTVYSFAAVLTVYLGGTAIGAALYQSRHAANDDASEWRSLSCNLLHSTAFFCLLGVGSLWLSNDIYKWVFAHTGPGRLAGFCAELSVATVVFLFPTVSMGALFSHLLQGGSRTHGAGKLLGLNSLGAAVAPLVFGVLLLPQFGARTTLVGLCIGYLLLPLLLNVGSTFRVSAAPAALAAAVLLALPLPLRFLPSQDSSKLIAYKEGVVAAVAVLEERDGSRHLAVNNHFLMGGTASRFSDHRQSHLPLLLHGNAGTALYLGLGTGITFQAAQYHPGLSATGVELIPELVSLMPFFDVELGDERWSTPPRVLTADARRFVSADPNQYDVVIAEVFHPSRDGAGSLYTVEHFAAIRERLAPEGLFCQWLPLFQLELDTLRLIVRSFLEVFPEAQMHLAHFSLAQPLICLLGGQQNTRFEPDWLLERVHNHALQQQLVQLRLNSDFALFGGYLGGAAALRHFAGDGPLNTDDAPLVTYQAPAFVYGDAGVPAERLQTLTEITAPYRDTLLAAQNRGSEFDRALRRYWQARDIFLAAGVGVKATDSLPVALAQIREPLLSAVRTSADFSPAYGPLLQMARSLAAKDPDAAIDLLRDLESANPSVSQARLLRQQLSAQSRSPGLYGTQR